MQVIRDRPSPTLGYAISQPMWVAGADRERHRVDSWSLRGFKLATWADAAMGARLAVDIYLEFQGYEIGTQVQVEVVGSGEFDFVELSDRTRELMEQLATDIVHGRITSVADSLLRLDTPEEPISLKPDAPTATSSRRVLLRPLVMSTLYIALGLVVFGYVGVLLHATFVKLEVQTAVVTRPVEVLAMPVDGRLTAVRAAAGERLRAGELIAVIRDPELDAQIDAHRIALTSARAAVQRLLETIEIERARLQEYRLINRTDARMAEAELEALHEDRTRAAQNLDRVERLWEKGHATAAALDDARAEEALALSRLTAARLMVERTRALRDVSDTRHHNGNEFVLDLDLLGVELAAAQQDEEVAAARLAVLLERKADLAMTAPFDARVLEVRHAPNTPLLRGTSVITLERDVSPVIEAFLSQEEVVQIGLGDQATVFLPSLDRRLDATVVQVDRTSSFVDEQDSQYTWRGPEDRSAKVVLVVNEPSLISGLPAIVLFNRRGTNVVTEDLTERLGVTGDDV